MERERKYRAWDGRKMYYASLDDLIFSMGSQGAGDWTLVEQVGEELAGFAGRLPGQTTMIYMDSIGMTDKNERDVYEGDVIRYLDNTSKGLVEKTVTITDIRHLPDFSCSKWQEVIGDVYEHPNLIAEEDG